MTRTNMEAMEMNGEKREMEMERKSVPGMEDVDVGDLFVIVGSGG
jgi:hypothetical protein